MRSLKLKIRVSGTEVNWRKDGRDEWKSGDKTYRYAFVYSFRLGRHVIQIGKIDVSRPDNQCRDTVND